MHEPTSGLVGTYLSKTIGNFLGIRYSWSVNIIYTRTNSSTILHTISEHSKKLLIRAGVLNGDDIGIHVNDGMDDVIEVGIAHVRMDLHHIQNSQYRIN